MIFKQQKLSRFVKLAYIAFSFNITTHLYMYILITPFKKKSSYLIYGLSYPHSSFIFSYRLLWIMSHNGIIADLITISTSPLSIYSMYIDIRPNTVSVNSNLIRKRTNPHTLSGRFSKPFTLHNIFIQTFNSIRNRPEDRATVTQLRLKALQNSLYILK